MDYSDLLANAPKHDSLEFLEYLRKHNEVVCETKKWLVIVNFKYDKKEARWYTAFLKKGNISLGFLQEKYGHLTWLKKSPKRQTVQRFHIHLYEENDSL